MRVILDIDLVDQVRVHKMCGRNFRIHQTPVFSAEHRDVIAQPRTFSSRGIADVHEREHSVSAFFQVSPVAGAVAFIGLLPPYENTMPVALSSASTKAPRFHAVFVTAP